MCEEFNEERCVHTDKNLVLRLGTTWLGDIKHVVVVDGMGDVCRATFYVVRP